MKIFIDSADVAEIEQAAATGLIDGVTTNPTLIAKSGGNFKEVIAQICAIVPGPVSAEVASTEHATMVKEGKVLASIASNVVVKAPLTWDGLRACRDLTDAGIKTNITLCFSVTQAWLAAKAGATYISPFVGRVDDVGGEGMELIREIRAAYDIHGFETEVLAASLRSVSHAKEALLSGADVATLPAKVFNGLLAHPLTDKGLAAFVADWKSAGQSIL